MALLKTKVVTQEGVLYDSEVKSLSAPAVDGIVTILPSHAAYTTLLQKGTIIPKGKKQEKLQEFKINSGFMTVKENLVTLLVDPA